MAEMLIKFFILLVGFGMGFLVACIGASGIVAEKHDLKRELAKVKAERDELKGTQNVKVIEINAPELPSTNYFEEF